MSAAGLTFTALFLPASGESSEAVSHVVQASDIDDAARLAVAGCADDMYLAGIWQVGVSADLLAFHAEPEGAADDGCEGHPNDGTGNIGETIYCDGSCRQAARS